MGAFAVSLRARFILLVVGLFVSLTLTMIVAASYIDLREDDRKAADVATVIARTVSRLASDHIVASRYGALESELRSIASDPLVLRAYVFDVLNEVSIDGGVDASYEETEIPRALIDEVLASGRRKVMLEDGVVEVALPVLVSGNRVPVGVALVVYERPDASQLIQRIWFRNALIALFLIAGAMPLTVHFGNGFLRPIRELTRVAHRVSAGDFDAPFPVERRDEIGVLARAYSDMVRTIRGNLERIHQLAFIDSVTRLANRESFRAEMEKAIAMGGQEKAGFAVLFIDLDRFKRVNDTYGHDVGDKLLAQVARRLSLEVCGQDRRIEGLVEPEPDERGQGPRNLPLIARLGGDEFAVLLRGCISRATAACVAQVALGAVRGITSVDGIPVSIGASIGIAIYPHDGHSHTVLMKNADIAMYAAKTAGGLGYAFYNAEADRAAAERMRLETELKLAVPHGELVLHYQPQVAAGSGALVGAEALLRWNHPERGLIGPGAFIGLAEETGLIVEIGRWVLREACLQTAEWHRRGQNICIAVNISQAQFRDPDGFAATVMTILEETGLPPTFLELEITESMAMRDAAEIACIVDPLRDAGVRFAIDDFGTGYSSLAHLTRLPFDIFKIDQNFTAGIGQDQSAEVIVQTILAMAGSLNYDTVAEGVETREQLDFLTAHGCTMAQGYLIGKPMTLDNFEGWMGAWHASKGTVAPRSPGAVNVTAKRCTAAG
ncbi:EAL domain-containing protein [Breoghania sp.]|uniref:putative bifunctional diguanylate cyclase/phosphodiesterase n=1 Tax=Breoghania sp. TaxID=2065378 RepID=UPI002AA67312|nr:EAL domain-containing protein [Breoghania sp.]